MLAGRFPRPHRARDASGVTPDQAENNAVDAPVREQQVAVLGDQRPLPLLNSVTGINHRPSHRARAANANALRTQVSNMPLSTQEVVTGQ
eukprot:3828180-Pleurochrysis_carterae.AAC.1